MGKQDTYSETGQAGAVIALMEQLGISGAVLAGYDIGSFIAQTVAKMRPDLVRALVVSPPLPGSGDRVLELGPVREFWYSSFHKLPLVGDLVDGNRFATAIRERLEA